MRLYLDIDTGVISRTLGGTPLSVLAFYLSDIVQIQLYYVQDGEVITSTLLTAGTATQKVTIKEAGDTTVLAQATTYDITATASVLTLSLNAAAMHTYFTDEEAAGRLKSTDAAALLFEIEVTASDDSTRTTYFQCPCEVRREISATGDTPLPEDSPSLYVLKSALFDGSSRAIAPQFVGVRSDITSAAIHRAVATAGRTLPWVIITLESNVWCTWTLRTKGVGEVDDGDTYRQPDDHNASTNNVIWVRSGLS